MRAISNLEIWLAAGVRTPFAKSDGTLSRFDAISLSVPVVRHMIGSLGGATPDFAVWGTVVPNPTWSNIAREVLMDAGVAPTIPAFSTVMACSTSMVGAIEAAGMINGVNRNLALVGGVETLSLIPLGLGQPLADWIRKFQLAPSLGQKVSRLTALKLRDIRLYIPRVVNRTTGLSMGEHTETTAKEWGIRREDQDRLALEGHERAVAAWDRASSTIWSFRSASCAETTSRARIPLWKGWRVCRRPLTGQVAKAR
jgi:acetyl-CoA C-acetyltransferase